MRGCSGCTRRISIIAGRVATRRCGVISHAEATATDAIAS